MEPEATAFSEHQFMMELVDAPVVIAIGKVCRRCLVPKGIDDYYKHPSMSDGHLNVCIECKRSESISNRELNIDRVRKYDNLRNRSPKRVATRERINAKLLVEDPQKIIARRAVSNALRDGRIVEKPCYICTGVKNIEAHHEDYSRPLDVIWFCAIHHRRYHAGRFWILLPSNKWVAAKDD